MKLTVTARDLRCRSAFLETPLIPEALTEREREEMRALFRRYINERQVPNGRDERAARARRETT